MVYCVAYSILSVAETRDGALSWPFVFLTYSSWAGYRPRAMRMLSFHLCNVSDLCKTFLSILAVPIIIIIIIIIICTSCLFLFK